MFNGSEVRLTNAVNFRQKDYRSGQPTTDTVRQSLSVSEHFPDWLASVVEQVTSITTGKPLPGQKRLLQFPPLVAFLLSLIALTSLIGLNIAALTQLPSVPWPWYPAFAVFEYFTLIATTGRFRSLQVGYAHAAIHGMMSHRWPFMNRVVEVVALAVSLGLNPQQYKHEHIKGGHHKRRVFATKNDADADFLYRFGFRPGMSVKALWQNLWLTIFSPAFHVTFAESRMKSALIFSDETHRKAVLVWIMFIVLMIMLLPWWAVVVAIIVPLGPLLHISSLLQFLTEHRWMISEAAPTDMQQYADRCCGRFCGEALPKAWGKRCGWFLRMLLVHLPTRIGILVGDLPAHDAHHLAGPLKVSPLKWRDAIFERENEILRGDQFKMASRENWGLKAQIDWVFEGLSTAK